MPAPSPIPAECPTLLILQSIADKWAVLILASLWKSPLRFNELRRTIGEISQKMLSQTLKSLERDGLVHRQATATVPVTVEYSITSLGETLASTVDALRAWSESNIGQVLEARLAYDREREVFAAA